MKNKNTTLRRHAAPALAALALIAASCSQEITDPQLPDNGQSTGKMITVTAIAPGSGNDSQTRTSIADNAADGMTVNWKAGDAFVLIDQSNNKVVDSPFTLKDESAGSKKGTFTGNAPSSGSYLAFFPAKGGATTHSELYNNATYEGQKQSANDNTEHLGDFDYCQSNVITDFTQPIAFAHKGCVFRFKLTMPAAGTPRKLTLYTEEDVLGKNLKNSRTDALTLTFDSFAEIAAGEVLKAYMMMNPSILKTFDNELPIMTLTLTCTDATYSCQVQTVQYTAGKAYDFVIAATDWKEEAFLPDDMKFTIDLTDYADKTYVLPFQITGSTDKSTLTVDWGDGSTPTTIPPGTSFELTATATTALLTHTYPEQKEYTITIASTQTNITKAQMPQFRPGHYRTEGNNKLKLRSMDSPMLNTKQTLNDCFNGCTKLTRVSAELFDKNTSVVDFAKAFQGCSSLAEIPAGLFDKNTLVVSFTSAFLNCTSLAEIPAGLFDKNTAAKNFGMCFNGCTSLTEIPAKLFAQNTLAVDFNYCFQNCAKVKLNSDIFCDEASGAATRFLNQSVDFTSCFNGCGKDNSVSNGGTAPALWTYTYGTGTPTAKNCFLNVTKVTNVGDILKAWGGPKE